MTTTPIIAIYMLNNMHQVSPIPMQQEDNSAMPYSVVPQSESAQRMDKRLDKVQQWLETLEQPNAVMYMDYKMFMWYCTEFFTANNKLWCKDPTGQHKLVIPSAWCIFLLTIAHNDVGHHRVFSTNALLAEQYWWLLIIKDIA